MASVLEIKVKLDRMWPHLNERARRMVAASEATQIGYGGVTLVSHACGLSRVTINKGIRELSASPLSENRIRQPGGGRRRLERKDPGLVTLLESLVEPLTRGDPESPLRWTCKSTRTLAGELVYRKHPVSHEKVAQYLRDLGYSLQGNRKTEEGEDHPDRDAQFRHINREVRQAMTQGWPVVSVDTKKKELIGNFANKGQQWRRKKTAEHVKGHDFPDPSVPRAYPYGIYDHARNTGFVNVGTDHDTATFAVASIRGWWRAEGRRLYPAASQLLITADGGGSNGYRLRLWKLELQHLVNELRIPITVCHLPPGTSKWNTIEHRLFSFITQNWRGKPLVTHQVIVNLIAATTTKTGLQVHSRLDRRLYAKGRRVSDRDLAQVHLEPHAFHGEWNYTIHPTAAV